jgi:hypothetical protein
MHVAGLIFIIVLAGAAGETDMDTTDDASKNGVSDQLPGCISGKVVYASTCGARLDSNVHTGGGTDDTEVLQAVLDRAPELGGLHLVMDGAALVRGLRVHSNTTIECLNADCGFFQASQSNCAVVENANPDFTTIRDRNIRLLGGTYNQNCPEQEHDIPVPPGAANHEVFSERKWVMTLEFYGVENLLIRDVTIQDQRTFAMLCANFRHCVMENITIDLPHHVDAQNQDGLHFWGPGQFLTLRDIRGRSGDDFIALAPDEHDHKSDITDVLIDGVHLDNADQGIRLLSRGAGRLDRVVIRNVTGTYRSYGFIINPWFDGPGGNYGSIVFDTIDLRATPPNYHYHPPFLFRVGGNIESLVLKNIIHHNPSDSRMLMEIGGPYMAEHDRDISEPSHVQSLVIDGLHIQEDGPASADARYINIRCRVDNLILRNSEVIRSARTPIDGSLVSMREGGSVGLLSLSGVSASRMARLVEDDGNAIKVFHEHAVDVFEGSLGKAANGR